MNVVVRLCCVIVGFFFSIGSFGADLNIAGSVRVATNLTARGTVHATLLAVAPVEPVRFRWTASAAGCLATNIHQKVYIEDGRTFNGLSVYTSADGETIAFFNGYTYPGYASGNFIFTAATNLPPTLGTTGWISLPAGTTFYSLYITYYGTSQHVPDMTSSTYISTGYSYMDSYYDPSFSPNCNPNYGAYFLETLPSTPLPVSAYITPSRMAAWDSAVLGGGGGGGTGLNFSGDMSGSRIVNLGAPTLGSDAATRSYVDAAAAASAPSAAQVALWNSKLSLAQASTNFVPRVGGLAGQVWVADGLNGGAWQFPPAGAGGPGLLPVDGRAVTNSIVMGTQSLVFGGGSGLAENFFVNGEFSLGSQGWSGDTAADSNAGSIRQGRWFVNDPGYGYTYGTLSQPVNRTIDLQGGVLTLSFDIVDFPAGRDPFVTVYVSGPGTSGSGSTNLTAAGHVSIPLYLYSYTSGYPTIDWFTFTIGHSDPGYPYQPATFSLDNARLSVVTPGKTIVLDTPALESLFNRVTPAQLEARIAQIGGAGGGGPESDPTFSAWLAANSQFADGVDNIGLDQTLDQLDGRYFPRPIGGQAGQVLSMDEFSQITWITPPGPMPTLLPLDQRPASGNVLMGAHSIQFGDETVAHSGNLVQNGDFSSSDHWSNVTGTILDGRWVVPYYGNLEQVGINTPVAIPSGAQLVLTFDVSNLAEGRVFDLSVSVGGNHSLYGATFSTSGSIMGAVRNGRHVVPLSGSEWLVSVQQLTCSVQHSYPPNGPEATHFDNFRLEVLSPGMPVELNASIIAGLIAGSANPSPAETDPSFTSWNIGKQMNGPWTLTGAGVSDDSLVTRATVQSMLQDWNGGVAPASSLASDGSIPMRGNLNLDTHRILNLMDPLAASDAATKGYVDAQITALPPTPSLPGITSALIGQVLSADGSGGVAWINPQAGPLSPIDQRKAAADVNLGSYQLIFENPTGEISYETLQGVPAEEGWMLVGFEDEVDGHPKSVYASNWPDALSYMENMELKVDYDTGEGEPLNAGVVRIYYAVRDGLFSSSAVEHNSLICEFNVSGVASQLRQSLLPFTRANVPDEYQEYVVVELFGEIFLSSFSGFEFQRQRPEIEQIVLSGEELKNLKSGSANAARLNSIEGRLNLSNLPSATGQAGAVWVSTGSGTGEWQMPATPLPSLGRQVPAGGSNGQVLVTVNGELSWQEPVSPEHMTEARMRQILRDELNHIVPQGGVGMFQPTP